VVGQYQKASILLPAVKAVDSDDSLQPEKKAPRWTKQFPSFLLKAVGIVKQIDGQSVLHVKRKYNMDPTKKECLIAIKNLQNVIKNEQLKPATLHGCLMALAMLCASLHNLNKTERK